MSCQLLAPCGPSRLPAVTVTAEPPLALTGRCWPRACRQPKINHWYLVLGFTVLRFAFFPLFMHCNNGQKNLSIVFDEDVYYIVFMVVFGLSNGYLSTLCMIYGPRCGRGPEGEGVQGFHGWAAEFEKMRLWIWRRVSSWWLNALS